MLRALDAAAGRALRTVAAPEPQTDTFSAFLVARCRSQPLLWPAAASYARSTLPGPSSSAIVAVPTGAGKSAVADLALQHAATKGWVLYLAPTNALVSQIRRQLRADHPGLTIREFFGGAEYTTLDGETLARLTNGQVFVMTPEKCSLALRQSPDAFEDMSLCILDEAHLLADRRGRGQLTELVLSEVLTRAPAGRVLCMSALIANPTALADWLTDAHDQPTIVVREPWRPTRTLRAVIGVEDQTVQAAAGDAAEQLAGLPNRRRNVSFAAPLAALAGLYGPWSTDNEADYALVQVAAEIPINVTRPVGGGEITIDVRSATVRPTVEALAQLLGDREQKVMAFLPRSKHDSFAAALSIRGFGVVRLPSEIDALLTLASAELGVRSLLNDTLAKGVGVHTSALLTEERRASELAFEDDYAAVLFATGTLAQGLNLPATTVIIGGTDIGWDPEQTRDEQRSRERTQLLNAIGRAGRAHVAARSLALVVPTRLPVFDDATPASSVLSRAEFLAEEDASTNLLSALRPLLQRLHARHTTLDDIHASDHVALSYLAPTQGDPELSNRLLRGTWAAYQLRIRDELEQVTATLADLSISAVNADEAPGWAAEAARRAAVPIPTATLLANFILAFDLRENPPTSVDAWATALVDALATFPTTTLSLVLDRRAFASTELDNLWSPDVDAREQAFSATRSTLEAWLAGLSFADIGGVVHASPRLTSSGRGPRDPIPRTIRVIEQGIGFGMTRAAGAMAAVVDLAVESGDRPELLAQSRTPLELLPVALRYGASGDLPLAFMRAGVRPRVVAHLLATHALAAPSGVDAAELQAWAGRQLDTLEDQIPNLRLSESDRVVLEAFLRTRGSR
ncbi:MAG: DEAD/DEAH box helicase [Solirubrobacteraceae bacterium]